MHNKLKYSILFFAALFLWACKKEQCASKAAFLESFEIYLTEKQPQQAEQDSVIFDAIYRSFVNDCYKKFRDEMTLEERQEFWKSSLKHVLAQHDGEFNFNLGEQMKDPFNKYIGEEVKALIKESGFSFIMELQATFKEDLAVLMDLFSSQMDNLAEEMMKMFQN